MVSRTSLVTLTACLLGTFFPSTTMASSPSCSLNGTMCPPPNWAPTWNLTLSTVCQPSSSGYFVPPVNQPWGLVSLDWSVAESIWLNKTDKNSSTCEATSIEGCRLIKQASPGSRCMIYHNMELALSWEESQRAVMYDPTKKNYFLLTPSGEIYNEPRMEGDQFFWNFTNPDAADYYISSVLSTLQDPAVDGTFTDDVTGVPAEHPEVQKNCNMTDDELATLQYNTQLTNARLIDSLVAIGKYNWQAWGAQDGVGSGISKGNCASWLSQRCSYSTNPQATFTMGFDPSNAEQSIAGFLIVRPGIAYIGFGWESDMRDWNSIFTLQVGEPQSGCYQSSPGVFTRAWTYGNVTLDCNTYTATIPHA